MYPVVFDVQRPERFERAQVFLRLLLLVLASFVIGGFGSLGLLYLAIPVVAAVLVSQKDGARYLEENGPELTRALGIVVGLLAYLMLLTDKLPGGDREAVRFEVTRSGSPTAGSALARIVTAIPSALVLALLGLVSGVVWVIAAISVLIDGTYSESLYGFQRGVLRWEARLLAYVASLVEAYPPFSVETGPAS